MAINENITISDINAINGCYQNQYIKASNRVARSTFFVSRFKENRNERYLQWNLLEQHGFGPRVKMFYFSQRPNKSSQSFQFVPQ